MAEKLSPGEGLPEEALETPMWVGDSESDLSAYLRETLCKLIEQGEMFSGKRPLGNSGWFEEIQSALVEDGYISDDMPISEVKELVMDLICNWM